MKVHPRIKGILSRIGLALALYTTSSVPAVAAPTFPQKAVRVYLMEWRWDDVARECTEYLGPNGFKGVQVSAPNEHANVDNFNGFVHPWFERYGAVSYKIGNRSGTRTQFKQMIDTCHAAGVEVYADAIVNHMASTVPVGGTHYGIQGSAYTRYNHPDAGYIISDFHQYNDGCNNPNNDFTYNYSDASAVRGCRLYGLSDLKTETPKVQNTIATYLADLLTLGVDGFRLDAAKHIGDRDLKAIVDLAKTKSGKTPKFMYAEVLSYVDQPIHGGQYIDFTDVTVGGFSTHLSEKFMNGTAWKLREWPNSPIGEAWRFEPSNKAVVFVDTHDSQRDSNNKILSYKNQPDLYKLANVFMMAYPYGKPLMQSSFYFETRDWGAPYNADGSIKSVFNADGSVRCGAKEWICEHRWPLFKRLAAFRNFVEDAQTLQNWWSNNAGQIAFARGNKAFTAINTQATGQLQQTLQTGLPTGDYCDLFTSEFNYETKTCRLEGSSTEGNWVKVASNGTLYANLAPRKALLIHTDASKVIVPPPATVRMTGNFNAWNAAGTGVMTSLGNGQYQMDISLPAGLLEYKFTLNGGWAGAYGDDAEPNTLPQSSTAKNHASVGNISIQLAQAGTYRITFNSNTGAYSLSLTSPPINQAPIANAGADITVQAGQAFTVDGSQSRDPDGSISQYTWVGMPAGFTATGATARGTFTTVGTYTVTLTVKDNQGASSQDSAVITVTPSNNTEDWRRTVIFIYGQTNSGQDMFVRGGIDHTYAASIGRNCTNTNMLCAIPIQHLNNKNATTNPWKSGDTYLDWYGVQAGQSSSAQGTPLDWTTNIWPSTWGPSKSVAVDGFGVTPLNTWGQHYWMLDVMMDCSKAVTINGASWFEVKSFISNGPGWEGDVNQPGRPWVSGNHFAQCGKLNMFKRGDSNAVITNLP